MPSRDISTAELRTALHKTEASFRLLVDSVQDYAIFMLDLKGNVISWNTGAQRIKGYMEKEIIGQSFRVFYPEEDVQRQVPEMELETAAQAGRCEHEGWRVAKDGKRFFAHVIITPVKDEQGEITGFAKVTQDLSNRHRLEERFRQVVESAPSAIVLVNSEGVIEMVNTQAERIFGYSRFEMLGKTVELLIPANFSAQHPQLRSSYFKDPHSRPMGKGRDLYARRKDGSEFPVEIGLNPIETDEGTKVLSAIVDISERKRMEQRLRLVVDSAPNAMVMIDQAGLIEMVNAQAERVFGYAREELLSQPVEILVPSQFRPYHPGLRSSFFADPHSRPMGKGRDLYARRKDGSEFPVEIGLNPLVTDEGTKVLSAIVDISDRKLKEQKIEAALEEKNILLGEIHHRVKNNLQIVHSLLDLQSTRIDDPNVLEMLRDSQNRIRSMALIHQSLYQSNDFARVNFGAVLESLVPTLVESYRIDSDNIKIEINTSDVLIPLNFAIPCGLAINELITNAFKHAFPEQRSGSIAVSFSRDNGHVILSVMDDGVGFPDDFDLDNSNTLGLQLVSLLADQLNARLEIRRKDPTKFTLRFSVEATEPC